MQPPNNWLRNVRWRSVTGGNEFLHRTGGNARLSQRGNATAELPLASDFARGNIQNSLCGVLLVQLASNVRDTRKAAHIGDIRGDWRNGMRLRGHDVGGSRSWRNWRRGISTRILRSHSRRQIQLLQFRIAVLLMRKKLLDTLQAFECLIAHAVLHQNLSLQHQVLQS